MKKQENTRPDKFVRETVARLMAVQALYGQFHNKKPAKALVNDVLSEEMRIAEGLEIAAPDKKLLSAIIQGVEERHADLQNMVQSALKKQGQAQAQKKSPEPLLNAILLCGAYELLMHRHTDTPLIINEYLDITHSFYTKNEVSLVNAVLDRLSQSFRDS